MVPPNTKSILMPSDGTTDSFSLNYEKFLQYDEKDQKIIINNDCKSSFCISYFMKFGTVNVFQTYSPELSTDFQMPEDHLLIELPLC